MMNQARGSKYSKPGMTLSTVVIGASGDLAKKKTYPALFELYRSDLLPKDTRIWGIARSSLTHDELRQKLRPFLKGEDVTIEEFLTLCFYQQQSSYSDENAFSELVKEIEVFENGANFAKCNRLYYFAIPPNLFAETGLCIKNNGMAVKGWTRLIIEKPFGRDLKSCKQLLTTLSDNFLEENLYRIDHYLGKEMIQNLLIMRFSNLWYERLFNRDCVECIKLTFKEDFGTQGRGGYFDKYGIIRDIIQNHLTQVLTLLTMEPPTVLVGPDAAHRVRDAKVAVLTAIRPVKEDDVFLGQYEGYTDDPTITNKDTTTPTFAQVRVFVNNARWEGVPIVFKAGKEMEERKSEIRIQFKAAPAADFLFNNVCGEKGCPRNELVLRIQPNEAIYMKTNVKAPGFSFEPVQSELEVNYDKRYSEEHNPDAYSRLILDVIHGNQAHFVRDDELIKSWEIFTPILHKIDRGDIKPKTYKVGSRGPDGADEWFSEKSGFVYDGKYKY